LLKAENDLSADQKAHEIAKRKQHQYSNVEGKRVTWVLERVTGTKEVFAKELSEETEIYYKYVDQPFPE
jgi:hypothetical protein